MKTRTSLDLGKMDCFGLSDIGQARGINADQFLVADLKTSLLVHESSLSTHPRTGIPGKSQAQLLVVCDGIGGKSGQRASRMAVDAIVRRVLASSDIVGAAHGEAECGDPLQLLAGILQECREEMLAERNGNAARHELGTTVTLAFIVWPSLYLAHVGDSRCYLFRNRRMQQLTTDHTYAHRMVESGILAAEQVATSRWNNVLWNVVGNGAAELHPETRMEGLRTGDSLLLCTDGLFHTVPERTIQHILAEGRPAQESCQMLIDAARQAGATDNVTVIVARFHRLQQLTRELDDETVAASLLDRLSGGNGVQQTFGDRMGRNTQANGNSQNETRVT